MGSLRLISVCLVAVCLWAAAPTVAEKLAREAEKAEKDGKIVEAYLLFARAAVAEPRNPSYWTRASALRPSATLLSEQRLAPLGEPNPLPPPDSNLVGSLTREQLSDMERMTGPPHLRPVAGVKSFHMKAEPKTLYEKIAGEYGYTVIFDKDFNPTTVVKFDIDDIDYKGALHSLETATNTFIVPLSDKSMLVAQDTTQKRQDLEPNEAVGIPIPQRTSAQEAQELMMMVQQTLEIRRVALDPGKRLIYMRDRASKVELARALFSELSSGKPQVSMEVEFLSTGTNSSLNYGIHLPTQFPLVNFGSVLHSSPTIPSGFARFLSFGGGATFFGIGLTDAAAFATASRSDATSRYTSQLTASDGQPATLHIGDKYPIPTSAYIGPTGVSSNGSSTTYAVITTSSYADVTATAVSNTGSVNLVVNGKSIPFTIPTGANSVIGLVNIINSLGAGVGAQAIERGTKNRPYSVLVVASTLGITSVQLYDDPSGKNIALLKDAAVESSISGTYTDETTAKISNTNLLNLSVGGTVTAINLTDATNNLDGLRDAINASSAGVTASVLSTGLTPNPYYMQIVATTANTGTLQVYDDPTGANTTLFSSTVEVNTVGTTLGNSVRTGSNSTGLGTSFTPPPTFSFEDLGLVLKITPYVHDLEEVTLDVEAEFKVLGSGSYNGVPVISTRKFQGKIRLRTNQWAVVAGLMTRSDATALTGFPGLTGLPLFGRFLGETTKSKDTSELLLVIKPTVTSLPASEFVTRTFWFGSEMKPLTIL